ncbi:MAG: MBL fold metallo-hydrolase [Candidatus Omnitrophica bacterium]|nr:MBL fold metallo-hydrolase [Candidatus Omnitrophota bacterium]
MIKKIVVGGLETNCYIFADLNTKEAALIDPASDGDNVIKSELQKHGLLLKCIINTHGHGDHISSNYKFDAPIYIHKLDANFLENTELNLSAAFGLKITSPPASRMLDDGDVIEVGGLKLKVLHTPGHTPGGISLLGDGIVFTGDTLFHNSVGRTDFTYGSGRQLVNSIRIKLLPLADETVVYPGHGPSSTIGRERRDNTFISTNVA